MPSLTSAEIDINTRKRGNGSFTAFEDIDGPVAIGATIQVFDPNANVEGRAVVTEINAEHGIVFLSVDWSSLRQRSTCIEPVEPGAYTADLQVWTGTGTYVSRIARNVPDLVVIQGGADTWAVRRTSSVIEHKFSAHRDDQVAFDLEDDLVAFG